MNKILAVLLAAISINVMGQITTSDGVINGNCSNASLTSNSITFSPVGCLNSTVVPPVVVPPVVVPPVVVPPVVVPPVVVPPVVTGEVDIRGTFIPFAPDYTRALYQCEFPGNNSSPGVINGNPCGAYQIPVDTCSTGLPGVTKAFMLPIEDWQPGSYRIGNSLRFGFPRDAAMVFRFRTGPASVYGSLPKNFGVAYSEQSNRGPSAPRFIALSEKRCDFDYSKVYVSGDSAADKSGCYHGDQGDGSIIGFITASGNEPNLGFPYCQIKPNTTYYLSMRWENAGVRNQRGQISCPSDAGMFNNWCGTTLNFQ